MAGQAQIPDSETMSKSVLFDRLRNEFDFERLMRAERRASMKEQSLTKRNYSEAHEPREEPTKEAIITPGKRQCKIRSALNTMDPIMLCRIEKKKAFLHTRENGSSVQFNLDTLIDYQLSSGEFSDPQTRIPFTDDVLSLMDQQAQRCGLQKPSLVAAKKNLHRYSNAKQRRDALLGMILSYYSSFFTCCTTI
jgi:hypothetical protein